MGRDELRDAIALAYWPRRLLLRRRKTRGIHSLRYQASTICEIEITMSFEKLTGLIVLVITYLTAVRFVA